MNREESQTKRKANFPSIFKLLFVVCLFSGTIMIISTVNYRSGCENYRHTCKKMWMTENFGVTEKKNFKAKVCITFILPYSNEINKRDTMNQLDDYKISLQDLFNQDRKDVKSTNDPKTRFGCFEISDKCDVDKLYTCYSRRKSTKKDSELECPSETCFNPDYAALHFVSSLAFLAAVVVTVSVLTVRTQSSSKFKKW